MQLQVLGIIILSVSTVLSLLSEKPFLSLQFRMCGPFSSLLGYSPSQELVCVSLITILVLSLSFYSSFVSLTGL